MYEYVFVWMPKYAPFLLRGALVTVYISLISMALALLLGLLIALGRLSGPWWAQGLLRAYLEIMRGVPLVVQLLFIYFTLPGLGISLTAVSAGVLGLSLNLGAYLSEVFRSAIASIDKGQYEAGVSLGLSRFRAYRLIVLPQAFLIALPTLGGYFISLLKDCSLVSFISVNELLRNGTIIIASTFQSMQVYAMVAIIYLAMSVAASQLIRSMELYLTPAFLRPTSPRHRQLGGLPACATGAS